MPEKKDIRVIVPQRFVLAEQERNVWVVNAEIGTELADITDPGYWALVARSLRPYDQLEVRAEDGAWVAYLIVTGADRTWARVTVDRIVNLSTKDVALSYTPIKHQIAWKGGHRKYCVVRLSDGECVKDRFTSEEAAAEWLREHEQIVATP